MPSRQRSEKACNMGAGEARDSELEQELDSLYQKVAGFDQPEDGHKPAVPERDRRTPAAAKIPKPMAIRSAKIGRRRFRTGRFGWVLVLILFFLGCLIGFYIWSGAHRTAPLPGEGKRKVLAERPVADIQPQGRPARYAIQLRAYPEDQQQNALRFLEDARTKWPDVSLETVRSADRKVWHRILLGNFSTADEAADYQQKNSLTREHPYSFIQEKLTGAP
jgi:hypothetical protein